MGQREVGGTRRGEESARDGAGTTTTTVTKDLLQAQKSSTCRLASVEYSEEQLGVASQEPRTAEYQP